MSRDGSARQRTIAGDDFAHLTPHTESTKSREDADRGAGCHSPRAASSMASCCSRVLGATSSPLPGSSASSPVLRQPSPFKCSCSRFRSGRTARASRSACARQRVESVVRRRSPDARWVAPITSRPPWQRDPLRRRRRRLRRRSAPRGRSCAASRRCSGHARHAGSAIREV